MQVIIIFWSIVTFFYPKEDLNERLSVVLTLFLAAVTFLFVVGSKLPSVPYLTIMDKICLVTFFFLFMVAIESFVIYLAVERRDSPVWVWVRENLDFHSSYAFPIIYALIILLLCAFGFYHRFKLHSEYKEIKKSARSGGMHNAAVSLLTAFNEGRPHMNELLRYKAFLEKTGFWDESTATNIKMPQTTAETAGTSLKLARIVTINPSKKNLLFKKLENVQEYEI